MKKIAVLISNAGTGTNLQAIINAIEQKKIHASISVVMSDSADAYGLQRARKHNIPVHIYNAGTESFNNLLTQNYPIDYIILAGWKKIISDETIDLFTNRILNLHPGLIPDVITGVVKNPDGTNALWNRGKFTNAAVKNFLDNKATYAGSTVHFLTKEFDFGPVIKRCFEKILPDDTIDSLYTRLKQKENSAYVEALIQLCQ